MNVAGVNGVAWHPEGGQMGAPSSAQPYLRPPTNSEGPGPSAVRALAQDCQSRVTMRHYPQRSVPEMSSTTKLFGRVSEEVSACSSTCAPHLHQHCSPECESACCGDPGRTA